LTGSLGVPMSEDVRAPEILADLEARGRVQRAVIGEARIDAATARRMVCPECRRTGLGFIAWEHPERRDVVGLAWCRCGYVEDV
jgi:hypothetical protein